MSTHRIDRTRIRAITLDLGDTLCPEWLTIERAEAALHAWLDMHAPRTAAHRARHLGAICHTPAHAPDSHKRATCISTALANQRV